MKKYLIVFIILLICSSCSHYTCPTYAKDKRTTEYWAKTTDSVDQGKLTRRIKAWTKSMLCATFPDMVIQQKSTISKQKNWKGLTKGA